MKYFFVLLVAFFIVGCNSGGEKSVGEKPVSSKPSQNQASSSEKKQARQPAPDFTVSTINGRTISLSALKGKVVIVNFWATWCGPCVYEMPGLVRLYDKYKEQGLEVIGLSVDRTRSGVAGFVSRKGIDYPIAFADRSLVMKYGGIQAIPTTFFIDKKGDVVGYVVGARDESFFEGVIKKLLQEGE